MTFHIYDRAIKFILDGYEEINDPTIDFITEKPQSNLYRLGTVPIINETVITFSLPMENTDYYVTIKRYTATSGVIVEYGWNVSNLERESFTFTPPAKYLEGELTYEVRYYK